MGRSSELGCREEPPRRAWELWVWERASFVAEVPQNHGRGPCGMEAMRLCPGREGLDGGEEQLPFSPTQGGGGGHPWKAGCSSFLGPPQAFSDMPLSLQQAVIFAWNLSLFPHFPVLPSPAQITPPLRNLPDSSVPTRLL